MEISKELATNIVKEMKNIIKKDLNFINSDGIIIASTDEERVNTYHEGGKQAIKNNNVIRINSDNEYRGGKKGINLPLRFNNDIIGVIGISGEPKEIEKYGEIIKRMSEILIREAYLNRKEEEENEKERFFFETLIYQSSQIYNPIIFSEYIKEIETRKQASIILCKLNGKYELINIKRIYNEIKKIVKSNLGYIMVNHNIIHILIFEKSELEIEKILDLIEKKEEFTFGIGEIKSEKGKIKDSYDEALVALEWGIKNKEKRVFYKKLDLELIVKNIDLKIKNAYLKKILGKLTKEEIEEYKEILFYYEKYNGSLLKISKELFIHTNTLQYKLNKLNDKLDLDMRQYKDFCKLKIAFMLM